MAKPKSLEFTEEPEANRLLATDPLTLLIGMLLDQHIQKAGSACPASRRRGRQWPRNRPRSGRFRSSEAPRLTKPPHAVGSSPPNNLAGPILHRTTGSGGFGGRCGLSRATTRFRALADVDPDPRKSTIHRCRLARDDLSQRGFYRARVRRGVRTISPRWASVGTCDLYFYALERHHRPHVDVRGPGFNATLDVRTGEVLAGAIPARELRRVRKLLARHRDLALQAFYRTLEHDFAGRLEQQLEDRP